MTRDTADRSQPNADHNAAETAQETERKGSAHQNRSYPAEIVNPMLSRGLRDPHAYADVVRESPYASRDIFLLLNDAFGMASAQRIMKLAADPESVNAKVQMAAPATASGPLPKASPDHQPDHGAGPGVTAPKSGINKAGFIDHSEGANLRTGPAEAGGQKVRDLPLPPASRVFVSGTHPDASHWWYVTAYLNETMVRGYVQDSRVTTELPEPTAKLHQVVRGDTAEHLAAKEYGGSVRDGHDLRYYENVLLYVNKQQQRAGITGAYQDPGILGGGSNNVQLVAGHRIWLVSPAYAKALETVVPSGSLTGGAVAKVKRFAGHLEDILHSVTRCPQYFGEVAGDYAQAIRDHEAEIIGITAGFIAAEATSMFLAATPTGVGQIAAVVIQLALSAFGAAGMVLAAAEATKHATEWLTMAWTAQGKDDVIAAASKEFLKMLVGIAMAALSARGAKTNYRNALEIASSMPTGGLPAPAFAHAGQSGGRAASGAGGSVGFGIGAVGAAGNAMQRVGDADEEPGSLFDRRDGDNTSLLDDSEREHGNACELEGVRDQTTSSLQRSIRSSGRCKRPRGARCRRRSRRRRRAHGPAPYFSAVLNGGHFAPRRQGYHRWAIVVQREGHRHR